MAEQVKRTCSSCGAPLLPDQRFCSSCGASADSNSNQPTERTPNSGVPIPELPQQLSAPPPPMSTMSNTYVQGQPPAYQSAPIGYQESGNYQPPPAYAAPQKDSTGRVLGQIGCGMLAIILLVVALCGTAGYFAYTWIATSINSAGHSTSATYSPSNSGSSSTSLTPTSASIVTPINGKIIYSGVTITIQQAEQNASFPDDNSISTPGALRLVFSEQNSTSKTASFLYSDVAKIVLANGTTVDPISAKNNGGPDGSVTRSNWLDFPVSTSTKVDQLKLRLGTSDQAQMDIPLMANANLAQFAPKIAQPNKQTQYNGLTWSVTQATLSWSENTTQASKGTRYVTVQLKIDNPSSSDFNRYWGDYMRLKAGTATSPPSSDTSFPLNFAASSYGGSGTVIFPVPENTTNFSLIFTGFPDQQINQATIDFQIQ